MRITLNLITNLYSTPDGKGRQKIIKRNIKFKKTFDTSTIQVQSLIDNKGNVSRTRSIVLEGDMSYTALHSFEELETIVTPTRVVGFKK